MITPVQIREKARRLQTKAIAAWLADEPFFPRRIPADVKLPPQVPEAIQGVQALRTGSKSQRGFGYRVQWERRRSRSHGENDFPVAIYVDSMEDLWALSGEQGRWRRLEELVQALRSRLPALEPWVRRPGNWRRLLEVEDRAEELLTLTEYFSRHPRPDVFARQIPVASSKTLERNRRFLAEWLDEVLPPEAIDPRYAVDQFEPRYGLKYARPHFLLRVLDRDLRAQLGIPFAECSLPAEALDVLRVGEANVLLVENKVSLLSMPAVRNSLVLGGLGNGVTQLCDVGWLHDRPVTYWGDMDAAGFEILHRLRSLLPSVRSMLMDEATLAESVGLCSAVPPQVPQDGLELSSSERAAYERVCREGLRIEQEHLPEDLVFGQLSCLR